MLRNNGLGKTGGLWLCLALLLFPCLACAASRPQISRSFPPETKRDSQLEDAIRLALGENTFSYSYNRLNLGNTVGGEALVYLPGREYCGSGGCTLLVFRLAQGTFRLVSRISLTRTPVIVSSHATNGWKDLIIFVSGGGIKSISDDISP